MCPITLTINSQKLGRGNEQTRWEFAVNFPKRRPRLRHVVEGDGRYPRAMTPSGGCVPEMFVTSYSVTYSIYVPGKSGICFIIIVQFMMSANSRIRFALQIVLVCLYSTPSHYHHCANLSEDIELIKFLSDKFCRVCKIKHILSVIHYTICYTICGAVCFQFTHSLCDDWENIYIYIYTLSYYHHQVGRIDYYPLFRVRSWNNGVSCMSLYILMI